jgi:hypothetical protein
LYFVELALLFGIGFHALLFTAVARKADPVGPRDCKSSYKGGCRRFSSHAGRRSSVTAGSGAGGSCTRANAHPDTAADAIGYRY